MPPVIDVDDGGEQHVPEERGIRGLRDMLLETKDGTPGSAMVWIRSDDSRDARSAVRVTRACCTPALAPASVMRPETVEAFSRRMTCGPFALAARLLHVVELVLGVVAAADPGTHRARRGVDRQEAGLQHGLALAQLGLPLLNKPVRPAQLNSKVPSSTPNHIVAILNDALVKSLDSDDPAVRLYAIGALQKQDVVTREGDRYVVVDSLMREWIARRTF